MDTVFGKYKAEITGFTYDEQRDHYTCPAEKVLPFRHFNKDPDGRLNKYYRAAYQDCKNCPLKKECAGNATVKSITRTAYDEQYLSAYARQHSRQGWQMKKLRQSTVEPVFGSLTQYYGLSKISVLGKAGAHKVMLMSAISPADNQTYTDTATIYLKAAVSDTDGKITRVQFYNGTILLRTEY